MPRKKKESEEKIKEETIEVVETKTESDEIDEKRKKLLEKAKEIETKSFLSEKETKPADIKELKEEKTEKKEEKIKIVGKSNTLIPLDDYVKAGCYIGTKVITPDMRKYVYRRRADGIAIINTNIIDEKIGEAAKYISQYSPKDFVVVCKREAGWRAVKLFSELTGVRVFTKKYPAGIITNTNLPDFFETELVFVCDPWLDKNAMNDAENVKKRILAVCDTNNLARQADFVVPMNNKSNKSLGVLFYILAREYMKAHGIDKKLPSMEDFIGEKLEDLQPKRNKKAEEEKKKDVEKIDAILKLQESEERENR